MSDVALPVIVLPPLPLPERLASDEQLARQVSRGNVHAFATLYKRHHEGLFRYCCSIVRNGDDAQDALQSALLRALTALQAGERDLAVRPWLFRIVHNEAISLLRRRPAAHGAAETTHADTSIERTLEERERLASLVADLQTLPERQRAALVMRELAGLTMEEIAAALSTSPGAAKQALFEARTALQQLAEGRAMACHEVRRTISERDGRMLRGRKIRAHLRGCIDCCEFRALIHTRSADLRALTPLLPLGAVGAAVAKLLGHGTGAGAAAPAGAALTGSGTLLAGPTAASLTIKALAGVALMTAATAGTMQLELGRHAHRQGPSAQEAVQPVPAGALMPALAAGWLPAGARRGVGAPAPARARGVGGAPLASPGFSAEQLDAGALGAPTSPGEQIGLPPTPPLHQASDAAPGTQPAPVGTPAPPAESSTPAAPAAPAAPTAPSHPSPSTSSPQPVHPTPPHPAPPAQPPAAPAHPDVPQGPPQGSGTMPQSPGTSGQASGRDRPDEHPGAGATPATPQGAAHSRG